MLEVNDGLGGEDWGSDCGFVEVMLGFGCLLGDKLVALLAFAANVRPFCCFDLLVWTGLGVLFDADVSWQVVICLVLEHTPVADGCFAAVLIVSDLAVSGTIQGESKKMAISSLMIAVFDLSS